MGRTFYIIDGHAQIFRAYYAPFRELSSPSGEPTKATFVFTQWLLNLVGQHKPPYLAMAIDTGVANVFRRQIYPPYKANRPPPPPDFQPQERRILSLVRDSGIPVFSHSGFEADDLIATMTRHLRRMGFRVVLVSKDKDLRQLLDEGTVLCDMQTGQLIDAQRMERECGYPPQQAIDVQMLTGDPVDNLPGIPGVGPKTAVRLVRQYGSAEAILEHLHELTPRLRESFQKHAHMFPLLRQLVTLRDDVDLDFDPQACTFTGLQINAVRSHLAELGFTSLLKRLASADLAAVAAGARETDRRVSPTGFSDSLFASPASSAQGCTSYADSAACAYELVNTPERFQAFLQQLGQQRRFAFDTETDALGAMRSNLIGMSFSWQAGTGFYLPVRGPDSGSLLPLERTLAALRPILENPSVGKIGHNIKYDMLVMRKAGLELRGIEMDTMVAAFLLDASRVQYGLDHLALDLLNFRKIPTEDLIGRGRNQIPMDRVPLERVARYAAEDADITWRLGDWLRARLHEVPDLERLHDELEIPLIDVLAEMEFHGVAIDPDMLRQQSHALGQRAEQLREQILEEAGCQFNPDSTRQLADVLFRRLGLRVVKRGKTGPSTDVEVLEKLAEEHRIARLILEYRSLVKLKNTYLDSLTDFVNPQTGRIHASFHQTGAATGRLSCSDPNLQNIPVRTDEGSRIRMAFVPGDPRTNVLLVADYSQIELRVLAHFTEEPALIRAFERDEDVHAAVAAEVFGVDLGQVTKAQRAQAKIINFGIIYGISAAGLARRIEGLSLAAAQELIDAYRRRFPAIHRFMEQCVLDAQSHGYVQTILGRRRRIPELQSPVLAQRNAGERMAINSVIQGSAADLMKIAMRNIHRRLRAEGRPSRMLLQVHDELVFETPRDSAECEAEMIRQEMIRAMKLKVPLKVDVGWGRNWQEGKR